MQPVKFEYLEEVYRSLANPEGGHVSEIPEAERIEVPGEKIETVNTIALIGIGQQLERIADYLDVIQAEMQDGENPAEMDTAPRGVGSPRKGERLR